MKASRKALFLDRDGVINIEKNYVFRIADFEFVDGIFELCQTARQLGFLLIVVTNQAGIGRGYYSEADFQHLTTWMVQQFAARGVLIDRVYHCPHHPTAGLGAYHRDCADRKPNPGMILKAAEDFDLDLARCALIGDKDSDLDAGRAAGLHYLFKVVLDEPRVDTPNRGDLRVARTWLLAQAGVDTTGAANDSSA